MNQVPTASTATPTPADQRPHSATILGPVEAEKPTPYTPPTEWDDAEAITCAGAKGAILKACLYTPMWHGIPEGPTRLSVYSEASAEGELDAAGTDKLIADLGALLPKLAAMRAELPGAQEQLATSGGPLAGAAEHIAMQAVAASLAGLQTNPNDVSKRLHRAIDNAQGWHLAEVGDHAEAHAYADSRFSTAVDAMADALGAASNKDRMVRALRNALDMVIDEAGQ